MRSVRMLASLQLLSLSLSLLLLANVCCGFQSPAFRQQRMSTTQQRLSPESLPDIHTSLLYTNPSAAFAYLADAADAVAVEAAASDSGWWASYLQLFKTALTTVHDTIDGPLRANGFDQSWGLSIAIFTASARSLLVPISLQQSKSSEYIKALKPYMTEIREKFKDNKEAQNRAIGKLYEDANQNPLAGCFVSIAQLPIVLGLYRGVRLLAQDGVLDEPFLFIPSLEGPVSAPDYRGLDWLTSGWQTIDGTLTPSLGWETTLAFLVMPVILVLGQSLSMSVLSPPIDDSMAEEEKEQMEKSQRILKFLPLLIGFFSLQVPAGLTIYWFTSNFFTLAQSLLVRAYYSANPPDIELPDYWDALENMEDMTAEDKRKAAEAGISVGPKWPDLLEAAKFHVIVERPPLRESNPAWMQAQASMEIPPEFEAWVQGLATVTTPTTSLNGDHSSDSNNSKDELKPATAAAAASPST